MRDEYEYLNEKKRITMSVFTIIGLCILVISLVLGILFKILLRKRRKELEGFHGYIEREVNHVPDEIEEGWEWL